MSQDDMILRHLKAGYRLSGLVALKLGMGMKLATRISVLRDQLHDIRDEWVEAGGKRFKVYWLHIPKPQPDMFMSQDALIQHSYAKK